MSRSWAWRRAAGACRSGATHPLRALPDAVVWVAFILAPVFDAVTGRTAEPRHALTILATVAFTVMYARQVLVWMRLAADRLTGALTVAMAGLAVTLTLAVSPGWGYLYCYVAACAALVAPASRELATVLAIAVLAAVTDLIAGSGAGPAAGYAASALGVGLLLTLLRDLRTRNHELAEARAELARTAVVAERERFARDLHDLLGHSLSVIAIKAELAGRLLPGTPGRVAVEVADIESVARSALHEVREAVSGYRRPTLDSELEGARVALAAAGIDAAFDRAPMTLAPEVEAVLAWAVREGATNVIRHSGARHCEVRVRAEADAARVEVIDDGAAGIDVPRPGPVPATPDAAGHGLVGLGERAAVVHGRLEAGAIGDGDGYRLALTVPASEATA